MEKPVDTDIYWTSTARFELPAPRAPVCKFAHEFEEWALATLGTRDMRNRVELNQALILVTKKYHALFHQAPRKHQFRVTPQGHKCIFHVFMELLNRLMDIELDLDPPLYFPPPPPPRVVEATPPPQPRWLDMGTLVGLEVEAQN